jgi:hypothetical protein
LGALTIAFDITIVGVLALPWIILVIHLFFSEGEYRLPAILDWVKDQEQPVAAVLLFAMTYTLGSAVSRIAFDFFNDDDLQHEFFAHQLRLGVTEDRIHTSVYCNHKDDESLVQWKKGDDSVKAKVYTLKKQGEDLCDQILSWWVLAGNEQQEDYLNGTAKDLFGLQENQLLLKGEDDTLRLRQLHDQVMVLRGAAFNGLIAFSLCLFALGAKIRRAGANPWLRWSLVPVPVVYVIVAGFAILNHFKERSPSEPPYMEFTLAFLGVAGAWLIWKRPQELSEGAQRRHILANDSNGTYWRKERWGLWSGLAFLLMFAAALGWWSTETFYTQQVIYSYDSQAMTVQGTSDTK